MANLASNYTIDERNQINKAAALKKVTAGKYQHDVTLAQAIKDNTPVTPPPPPPPPPTSPKPPAVVPWAASARLVFEDVFEGTAIDLSKWNVLDNDARWGLETYRPAQVVVSNGTLKLIAKQNGTGYDSGAVSTRNYGEGQKFSFKYGYCEARLRLGKGGGFWPALWLVGAQGGPAWPAYGEIDIVEMYGSDSHMESNYHNTWGNIGARNHAIGSPQDWHTFGLDWTADTIRWIYDGNVVRSYTAAHPEDTTAFSLEHTIIINLAIGKAPETWHGWDKTWAPGELPGGLEVDWVRVWQQ